MPTVGFRITSQFRRASQELVHRAAALPTSNIGDVMNRVQCMSPEIRPFGKPGVPLAGSALPVKSRPADNLMLHKALALAQPGDVVVVDGGSGTTHALIGELMTLYAINRGVAGIIIDGPVRDSGTLAQLAFPIYAIGATPAGPYKDGPGEIGFPVTCGGVTINPGDILVGDEDGIVVIPLAQAQEIITAAEALHHKEEGIMADIMAGTWDRSWIDQALKAKGCKFLDEH